jgi:ADP-ribosylglycohydrolase
MKNSESHTNKDFTVEDLLTRGCTRTLIERFLEPEDYRDPVNHFRNYSGKKMFQRRRVELIEASAHWHRQPLPDEIAEIANGSFKLKEPPEIKNRGFVVRALEAALWAFHHSDSFTEGALRAVNLGDDADTIGAIYGQLAGPTMASTLSHRTGSSVWRCANSSAKRPLRCSTSRTHNA